MPKKYTLPIAVFFFVVNLSTGSSQDIGYVREISSDLSTKKFAGRGYIKNGVNKAAKYIAKEFKDLGLNPVHGNYFQDFAHSINTFPGKQVVAVNDECLKGGIDYLISPGSSSAKGKYKIEWIELDKLNALPEKMRGEQFCKGCAIVLDHGGTKDKDTLEIWQNLKTKLAEQFPVVVINHNRLVWSIGRKTSEWPIIEINPGLIKNGDELELKISAKEIQFNSKNVIAKVVGLEHPDTVIVFSAHYDHLGMMGKDAIFWGANDNASGTAMILNLAKYYQKYPPKYSVVFIAFAAEEAGLIGSRYFVEHPLIELDRIKFLINLDLVGFGEEGVTVVNGKNNQIAFDLLENINQEESLGIHQIKLRGQAANSDHYWFAENNVPAIFIYTLGGNQAYHDVFDKYENLTFHAYNSLFKLLVNFVDRF